MSDILPIIGHLSDAQTYLERAKWLLRCPLDILGRYDMTIRNRLHHVGFAAGAIYLDDIRIVKCAVRREDGQLSLGQTDLISDAAEKLVAAAVALDAAVPVADHSITEL